MAGEEYTDAELFEMAGLSSPVTNADTSNLYSDAELFEMAGLGKPSVSEDLPYIGSKGTEGVSNLLWLAEQVLPDIAQMNPPRLFGLTEYLTGSDYGPTAKEQFLQQTEDLGIYSPELKPKTGLGEFAGIVAENAPAAAIFGPLTGLRGAVGGLALESTGEAVGGPIGGLAASLIPLGGSKVSRAAEALSESTVEPKAAKVLQEWAVDAPRSAERLESAARVADDPFYALKTTGEIAQDPGLARLEDTLRATKYGDEMADIGERSLARRALLQETTPTLSAAESVESRGARIVEGVSEKYAEAEKAASDAWNVLNKYNSEKVPMVDIRSRIFDKMQEAGLNRKSAGLSKEVENILGGLRGGKTTRELGDLQNYKKAANSLLRRESAASDLDKIAAGIITSSIDEGVDVAVDSGKVSGSMVDAWRNARAATRRKYDEFLTKEKPLVRRIAKGQEIYTSRTPSKAISSPEAAREVLNAAGKQSDTANALRETYITKVLEPKRDSSIVDKLKASKDVAREIFDDPEHFDAFQKVIDDVDSYSKYIDITKRGVNSATIPKAKAVEKLEKNATLLSKTLTQVMTGAGVGGAAAVVSSNPIGIALSAIGALGAKAAGSRIENINDKVMKLVVLASKDKDIALDLLKAPTETSMRKLARALEEVAASSAGLSILGIGNELEKKGYKNDETPSANSVLNMPTNDTGRSMPDKKIETPSASSVVGDNKNLSPVKAVEAQIDSDPFYSAVYEVESGRNPKAKNPESSASGAFQLIKSTAKALGVNDVFDIAQNFEGMKKLTEENKRIFGDNPELLYAAHYLGAPLLKKWLQDKPLNQTERQQVEFLNSKALPRFRRAYQVKIDSGDTSA